MGTRKRRAEREAQHARRRTNLIVAIVVALTLIGGLTVIARISASATDTTVAATGLRACPQANTTSSPASDLPDQSIECLGDGPALNFASLVGKPTIINVWASWCPPCVEELPWLAALDDRANGAISIIGVDVNDDRASGLAMLEAAGVHYPSVFDRAGATRGTLQWTGTPITLFVDSAGKFVHRVDGRLPDTAALEQLVQQYLGVTVPANP